MIIRKKLTQMTRHYPRSLFHLQVYEKSRQPLKTTVNLRVCHILGVASPGITLRVECGLIRLLDRVLCLDELYTQTFGNVPCNVAMHEPDSGVVCREGDQQPTKTGKDGSVATGRIGKVEVCGAGVKDTSA